MSMSAQDLLVQLFRHGLKSWLLSPFSSSSTGFLLILQGLLISLHFHSSLFLWLLVMVRTGAEWTGSFFMQSEMILFCPPTPVPPLTFCVMVPLALQLRLHWAHCMLRLWCFPICWDALISHTLGSIWTLLNSQYVQKVSYCPQCALGLACLLPHVLKKLLLSEKGSPAIPL